MKQGLLILYLLLTFSVLNAQPKQEVRAAWLTTAYGLDWPRIKVRNPGDIIRQKEELVHILDQLKEANFNTVLFQARTRSAVFYRSKIEPFDGELTGVKGRDPGYDPLAFVIEECHKRGMECHAWLVAIPLGSQSYIRSMGNQSVVKKNHPFVCIITSNTS